MCDIFPGQLIVCFSKIDPAAHELLAQIQEDQVGHVSYVESIEKRLARLGLKPDPTFELELHLLAIPPGQETWKINYLQFYYKHALLRNIPRHSGDKDFWDVMGRSNLHFTVVPNHVLSLSTTAGTSNVSAENFRFGSHHQQYRTAVGLTTTPVASSEPVRILVLDSGIAPDSPIKIQCETNLVDPKNPLQAVDDLGHGTAVSLLIHDLAPFAEFVIYKVADSTGRVSEWDALAGLVAKSDAQIVNLSLQFGLPERKCNTCGSESSASRSAVFENIVQQLSNRKTTPVVVAAAGNLARPELAFPARFADVLAIGGITSRKELSSDSNFGDQDQTGANHANHFVAPGGEVQASQAESVVAESSGHTYQGTSFAAAFATGVIANRLARLGLTNYQHDQFFASLRQNADSRSLHNYSIQKQKYGHGVIQA